MESTHKCVQFLELGNRYISITGLRLLVYKMRLWSWAKSIPEWIMKNKSKIRRRLVIYLIIMLMIFPFVFVNRVEIYRTFLTRYDDWIETRDVNGIPITDYGYQAGVYIGPQTTIRMVGNLGIAYYDQFLDGNSTAGLYFNNTVEWLLEKRNVVTVPTENGSIQMSNWPYEFAIYDLPKGWLSGMVEAKALHTLALHYGLYGNASFLEIFDQVATTFETPISLGGDLLILEDGTHWYPEIVVPTELDSNYESPLILNGFLIALYHIYQANLILNNSRLANVFNLGVISAAQNLYKYDLPYNWTLYHLDYPEKLASTSYHNIHIDMCEKLYEYTNVTIFDYYATKWKGYTNRPSFTLAELFGPEFISNGILMAAIIFLPLLSIDIIQTIIRRLLDRRRRITGNQDK